MNKELIINALWFVGLLLFQVLVLNQVELHGFISPYIYPLFILLLPFKTPKAVLLLLGFLMGIGVDMFANTPGLHASATVLLAYLRPAIINLNIPPGGYEIIDKPHIGSMGSTWFLVYAGMSIFVHHAAYFFLEIYSLTYFFSTLLKVICSGLLSLLLMVVVEYLFYVRRI